MFFKKILLRLALSIFEKELLTELNVAPAHYIQIVGHLSVPLQSYVHNLAFRRLWKFFYIFLRPNIGVINGGFL